MPYPIFKHLGCKIPNAKHESLILRVPQTHDGKEQKSVPGKGNYHRLENLRHGKILVNHLQRRRLNQQNIFFDVKME